MKTEVLMNFEVFMKTEVLRCCLLIDLITGGDLNHIFLTHDRFHCHVTKQYGASPHQYLYLEQMNIEYIELEWHGE